MREAIGSFPKPEMQSACRRFRGEPGFQLYSWYAAFHYLIERHREALLWSYIALRSDTDGDGYLSWTERRKVTQELLEGMRNEGKPTFRKRTYYHVAELLHRAGLKEPLINTDVLWTSLDGPQAIQGLDCQEYDLNICLAPGFSTTSSATKHSQDHIFSTALIFDRLSRQDVRCGDCLLKLILNRTPRGLDPLFPRARSQAKARELVIKAVVRYQYSVVNPNAMFFMVSDAEQVEVQLNKRFVKGKAELPGQLCLNDDVTATDPQELADVKVAMTEFYRTLFPERSRYENGE
jgi:hypothetical protein